LNLRLGAWAEALTVAVGVALTVEVVVVVDDVVVNGGGE
jgi:adenine/guanine phosphoribosyltransferase-like PRPP-binding protein